MAIRLVQGVSYGAASGQEADLYLPDRAKAPVVCLLHGGFWRMPYGRDQMNGLADDLVARGLAVWNLEYRRLGARGAGWPATCEDVAAGLDHLAALPADLDLERVIVVGHSAGGHLALWGAARASRVRVRGVAALAPIADLAHAYALGLGAVAELLGGSPADVPERYRAASPIEMLPLGVRQLVLHGTADDLVPVELSRRYARAARAAGDDVELVELPGTGHMELLDPARDAHAVVRRWLLARADEP